MSSNSRQKQPSYLAKIRELTNEVSQQEKVASEKCKEIKKIVDPIFKKNGSTTVAEYRTTIKQIFALLENGTDVTIEQH